jgi:hypothetical protein
MPPPNSPTLKGFAITSFPAVDYANVSVTFMVTAKDTAGNTMAGYTGTIHFSSSCPSAGLPADYVFTASDNGVHQFSAIFNTPSVSDSLTVNDTVNTNATGTVPSFSVQPAEFFSVTGLMGNPDQGIAEAVTVTALDPGGVPAPGYTGTIHFSSSDQAAGLPADYAFTADDNSVHTFSTPGVTFNTLGTQSLQVADTSFTNVQGKVTGLNVLPASYLGINIPTTLAVNSPYTVTVTARDAGGTTATNYLGTVHFSSTDQAAGLPADYTFTANDQGKHSFVAGATFGTLGGQSLTVQDVNYPTITATVPELSVIPALFFKISGLPRTPSQNVAYSFTVTATDLGGVTASGYRGTVHFTGTDPQGTFPSDYVFTAADNGAHTFTGGVSFATLGSQTVTASDTVYSQVGSQAPTVNVVAAKIFIVTGFPASIIPGVPLPITVTAKDGLQHTVTGYQGTVHFTSSDPRADLPADYIFTADDNGAHSFTVTLRTAGIQSFLVQDTLDVQLIGSKPHLPVQAVPPQVILFSIGTSTTAGSPVPFTLTIEDNRGDLATGYTGTIHFSSSDPHAGLPQDYAFTAADQGSHSFSASLLTAGSQKIFASDPFLGILFGSSGSIAVAPGATSVLALSAPGSALAGDNFSITVSAKDAFGNVDPNFAGAIQITGTDAKGVGLPINYTFTAQDTGVHVFTGVGFHTAGVQTIAVSDVTDVEGSGSGGSSGGGGVGASIRFGSVPPPGSGLPSVTGASAQVDVLPAAASKFALLPADFQVQAGNVLSFSVVALDAFDNVVTGYAGSVNFSSTDSAAVLPQSYRFTSADKGQHVFSVTFETPGPQALTITDANQAGVAGTLPEVNVTGVTVSALLLTLPANIIAGQPFAVTVKALDAKGNVLTNYVGTVHFTSSDTLANLPANYTFTAADGGSHTFSGVLFNTAGQQSLTVADLNNAIKVSPSFMVSNPVPVATGLKIVSVNPANGDTTVLVNGSDFVRSSTAQVNGQNLATTFVSATQLQVVVPAAILASPGTFVFTVVTPAPGGGASASLTLTNNFPVPTANSVSPTSVLVGGADQTITVNGLNFFPPSKVMLNGTALTTTFVNSGELQAVVPAADLATAGTLSFTVLNPTPGGGSSSSVSLTVASPVPSLTSLSPTQATAGSGNLTLTVNGTNFVTSSTVQLNGTSLATTFVSGTQLTAIVPAADLAALGTLSFTVGTPAPGGGTTSSLSLTVGAPVPVLGSLSQTSVNEGSGDLTLTINGSGFVSTSKVQISGTNLATTFVSGTQLQAVIPAALLASPGSLSLAVVNPTPGGGTSSSASLTITDAPFAASATSFNVATGQDFNTVVATFTDSGPGDPLGAYSASINWGDGEIDTGVVTANPKGGFKVSGTHSYSAEGSETITVTISSTQGSQVVVQGAAEVFSQSQSQVIANQHTMVVPSNQTTATIQNDDTSATFDRPAGETGNTSLWVADYTQNPENTAGLPAGAKTADFFDIRVTGVTDNDTLKVVYHYNPDITTPTLEFFDHNTGTYEQVRGDPTIPNSYVVDTTAHTITVIYGAHSVPAITDLHGTVFAVVLDDEGPSQTSSTVTAALAFLASHHSGSDSGAVFSAEATFLSNNQLVLAVTPSSETEEAVSRASLNTGETSGTAETDGSDDPYSYWLRLLGDDLFLQWLQMSQAPAAAPTPVDDAIAQSAADDVAMIAPARETPAPSTSDVLSAVFEDSDLMRGETVVSADGFAQVMAQDDFADPFAALVPAAESDNQTGAELALMATLAGLGFAEARSFAGRAAEAGRRNVVVPQRSRSGGRSLSFTELPELR